VGIRFAKGHGTSNDFVVLPDPDGALCLDVSTVVALCDRRAGLGGDGVLRVVRCTAIPDGARYAERATWFMDYRNADGSPAEMCGNGARVLGRYLVDEGYAAPGRQVIGTRDGLRALDVPVAGDVTVEMGPAVLGAESVAVVAGRPFGGVAVFTGNPHLVCGVSDGLDAVPLDLPPEVDATRFPDGVNVELVTWVDEPVDGADAHVVMRVHERGVGETASCGTGAVAVAAVALRSAGRPAGTVAVDVPGGRLTVVGDGTTYRLRGPAVIIASGEIHPAWLAAPSAVR